VARLKVRHNLNYLMQSKKVSLQLSCLTVALGFDSDQDWSTAVSRKRRRAKKDDDEDDDYVVAVQPKPVNEDGVAKIMSTLLQAREAWVIIKLLSRLEVLPLKTPLMLDK
jgi:hypothetical protein